MLTLKEIGTICQRSRKARGLYQFHIADRFGCSVSSVSAFERGVSNNAEMLMYYVNNILSLEDRKKLGMVKKGEIESES